MMMYVDVCVVKGCVKVWDISQASCKTPVSQLDCLVSHWHLYNIGIASYGALEYVPPTTFSNLIFPVNFRLEQSLTVISCFACLVFCDSSCGSLVAATW